MKHKRHSDSKNIPSVQINISSPSLPTASANKEMLAHAPVMSSWDGYGNGAYLSALPKAFIEQRLHKRGSSGSSVTSAGPPSPLSFNSLNPHIATSDSSFPGMFEYDYNQTPRTSKSMADTLGMYGRPHSFGAVDMKRINSSGVEERLSYPMSGAQSVSSMGHASPATPHTTYEPDFDEKNIYGENNSGDDILDMYSPFGAGYPTSAYQQSMQDLFPDHQISQQMAYGQQNMPRVNSRQINMVERMHNKNSPTTVSPGNRSPFQQTPHYNVQIPVRNGASNTGASKARISVSPKELMLDENDMDDSNGAPLFQEHPQSIFSLNRKQSTMSNMYPPSFNTEPSLQIAQQYPFVSQSSRQGSSGDPTSTPEFPAHLVSMESTVEEGPSEASSQQSSQAFRSQMPTSQPMQRPVDTSADGGTYSCTYHGCALRFDSPAKLQKHKREGHRQASPASLASNAARNSQAGPHRCDRINPSTGKSCNSIFSRPYDLTRHEDTIHNARKLKVRCHLCTEEKTFSRNDALTRHMRVVHPEVDWVGKQKRKSHK